jgi:hypothetical protein
MAANRTKNSYDWMRITQFIIFCASCIIAVIFWYYAQQERTSEKIEGRYATKTELQLIDQKLDSVETSLKEMKIEFSDKLKDMENTNNTIIDLVTDIRLTLARGE